MVRALPHGRARGGASCERHGWSSCCPEGRYRQVPGGGESLRGSRHPKLCCLARWPGRASASRRRAARRNEALAGIGGNDGTIVSSSCVREPWVSARVVLDL